MKYDLIKKTKVSKGCEFILKSTDFDTAFDMLKEIRTKEKMHREYCDISLIHGDLDEETTQFDIFFGEETITYIIEPSKYEQMALLTKYMNPKYLKSEEILTINNN